MLPLFAVQLEVDPPEGVKPADVPRRARARVLDAVRDAYAGMGADLARLVAPGTRELVPIVGHCIRVDEESDAESSLWRLDWRCAVERSFDRWTRCEIASDGRATEVWLTSGVEAKEFSIAPTDGSPEPPSALALLAEGFACRIGTRRLVARPQLISAPDVGAFVEALCDPQRRIPFVVLSPDATGRFVTDAASLARRLLGLAEVVVLPDKWATFALTDRVGKRHSCYLGALRVYWPGFDAKGDPFRHPLFFPDRLHEAFPHESLADGLLRRMAQLAVIRSVRGPTARRVEALLGERRRREASEARSAIGADLDALFDELTARLDRLEGENTELRARNALLEQRLAGRAGIRETARATDTGATDEPEPEDVRAAVERAVDSFRETLIFARPALTSADESPFKRPGQVLRALEAMDDVCRSRIDAIAKKESIGSLEQAFRQRGFDYRARESMTAKGKWSEEYEIVHDGKRIPIEQHLALGTGGPEACLRIHFHVEESTGRFIVGHVGRHKTNTKS